MLNGNRVLVTGGAGFIGSNFVRFLMQNHDCEVVNFDALTYAGNRDNTADLEDSSRYTFVRGDIRDRELVHDAMQGCDVVVHFAAESHVDRSISSPSRFIDTNVLGTGVLLDCARENDVERFVFMSTDEVYGSTLEGSFTETDCLDPTSPYASSKAGADLLVQSYHETYALPTIIVRCTNNFGPYQYPEKLIPLFITNLLEDQSVPVYGSGRNVRDWIYVPDTCRAIEFLIKNGVDGEAYNVSGQNPKTNIEVTETILEHLGKDSSYVEYVDDRPAHDFRYAVDASKIERLGWTPRIDFDSGLERTITWYKNHVEWWKSKKNNSPYKESTEET